MNKDKKIKNILIDQPSKTFDEFCYANNIQAESPERKKRRAMNIALKYLTPALSAAAIVLAIVLPVTLKNNSSPSGGGSTVNPLMYSKEVTYEQVVSDKDVILMNMEYMFDENTSFGKMFMDGKPADDSSHVGYTVANNGYGAEIYGEPYTYGFTLTTAKSTALSVIDKTAYNGCDSKVTYDGVEYNYKVDIGLSARMHVYYSIGKYEYFLSVTPFGTAARADENYMLMFLRLAFDEVENAERIEINLD